MNKNKAVTVKKQGTTVSLEFTSESFGFLSMLAARRCMSIEEVIVEALRVEQLLADGKLFYEQRGRIRELLSA